MNQEIAKLVDAATRILIIQADNPDGDSLGTSLALESILGNKGKEAYMYCGVDMPGYIRYLEGWDRVSRDIPRNIELSIIVDASTNTLLHKLQESPDKKRVYENPVIVLDHHETADGDVPFADVVLNNTEVSSTGELVYQLANELQWPVDVQAGKYIMTAILGDTQGLSNELAKNTTYRVMAELTELGVHRPSLEEARREYSKMPAEIFRYKSDLIKRTEFHANGQLAVVSIPQHEITNYSPLYNPAPLIQGDMLQTSGVGVAVVLKHYDDGKILGSIRCNQGYEFGAQLAEHFGGGGHKWASGFKLQDGRPINEVKSECIRVATNFIDTMHKDNSDDKPTQHSF